MGCPLEKARHIADDVVRSVGDYRFVWKDKIFTIGVSVGIVEISRESGSLEDLVGAADSACYVAKRQGGHVHVYSARDEPRRVPRRDPVAAAAAGRVRDGLFELHAQPIIASTTRPSAGPASRCCCGCATTTASRRPGRLHGRRERYRLMPLVDRWVVQAALSAFARGVLKLPPGRSLCINLSGDARRRLVPRVRGRVPRPHRRVADRICSR